MDDINNELDKYFEQNELDFFSNLTGKSYKYTSDLNPIDGSSKAKDDLYFDFFQVLLSTVIIADKISTVITQASKDFTGLDSVENLNKESEKYKKYLANYTKIKEEINDMILLIFDFSKREKYFWKDCPTEVYINSFKNIKTYFLESNSFSNELDFIKNEIEYFLSDNDLDTNLSHLNEQSNDYLALVNYRKFLSRETSQLFQLEKMKKIQFLRNELKKLGHLDETYAVGDNLKIKLIQLEEFKEEDLQLSGLPKLNVQQRFELFKRLGFEDIISKLDTDKQMSKYKILALIMGINPDNAKQLHNRTYKEISDKDINTLNEYLVSQSVMLKSK